MYMLNNETVITCDNGLHVMRIINVIAIRRSLQSLNDVFLVTCLINTHIFLKCSSSVY